MIRITTPVACALIFFSELAPTRADEIGANISTNEASAGGLFENVRYEATLNNGVLFSPFLATGGRPTINYTITEVQVGYLLSEVKGHGWLRGNFELVGEGFGSAIFHGEGSFIAGVTFWLRYNFVPPGWRLVPYTQLGAGLTSTDITHKVVGQPFNFNLELGIGTRYLLSEHWGLNLEYRYQHISNADTGAHNIGINACGPIVGVSYLF
jgi:opacity protein-like surface antigen